MSDWKPIDTAPKDGRTILARAFVGAGSHDVFIRWDEARATWVHADGGTEYTAYDPALWIPAPAGLEKDVAAFKAWFRRDWPQQ